MLLALVLPLLRCDKKTRPVCSDFHHVREVKEWPKLRLCRVRAVRRGGLEKIMGDGGGKFRQDADVLRLWTHAGCTVRMIRNLRRVPSRLAAMIFSPVQRDRKACKQAKLGCSCDSIPARQRQQYRHCTRNMRSSQAGVSQQRIKHERYSERANQKRLGRCWPDLCEAGTE